MPIEVKYWKSGTGECPVLDFIRGEPIKAQEKIEWQIDRLRRYGLTLLGTTDFVKKLKGYDLYELRIKVKRVLYRIIFVIKRSVAWLLVLFKKQGDKTPKQYLNSALSRASQI